MSLVTLLKLYLLTLDLVTSLSTAFSDLPPQEFPTKAQTQTSCLRSRGVLSTAVGRISGNDQPSNSSLLPEASATKAKTHMWRLRSQSVLYGLWVVFLGMTRPGPQFLSDQDTHVAP